MTKRAWIVALAVVALACSDDTMMSMDSGAGDAGDAATDVSSDASLDTSDPSDTSVSDGGDTSVPDGGGDDIFDGTASLSNGRTGGTVVPIMGGFFAEGVDLRRVIPGCTFIREVGACLSASCLAIDPPDDAGTLSASVDSVEVASATAAEIYVGTASSGFSAGQTITLSATGATVPAFSADVVGPPTPTTTLPTSGVTGAPLELTWDAALVADEVEVSISGPGVAVVCRAEPSAGSVTVDGAITADLTGMTNGTVKALNITPVVVGDYRIAVTAGDSVGGMIAFE